MVKQYVPVIPTGIIFFLRIQECIQTAFNLQNNDCMACNKKWIG